MKTPNLFIVGAPKCGTTSLYRYLRDHPEIYMCVPKEPHYFGKDLRFRYPRKTLEKYLSYFKDAHKESYVGESSTSYLYSNEAAEEIKAFSPNARIIIMLRNPMDMMYSLHSQHLYTGNEDILDFRAALEAEKDRKAGKRIPRTAHSYYACLYRERAAFAEQVSRFLRVFGRENVHIILFDDLAKNAENVCKAVLSFLDLDTKISVDFSRYNPNRRVKSRLIQRFTRSYWTRRMGNYLVPSRTLLRKIFLSIRRLNRRYESRPPMDAALRLELKQSFTAEIMKLSRLIQRDLTDWLK